MAELVEGRVNDRRHGDTMYMPVATYIPNLIKITIDALQLQHALKTKRLWRSQGLKYRVLRGSLFHFAPKVYQVPLTTPAI